ncbi:MAG: hypothetical protein JO342_12695 [Solirubrobacterales bacterium]|nr:hypothetical protein [Solirubrobacterales bacterium]MBV9167000.1 hypothetical protein [Solirubrobacterales bacterium]
MLEAGGDRPHRHAEVAAGAGDPGAVDFAALHLLDIDDRRRPRPRPGRQLGRPELRLAHELRRRTVDGSRVGPDHPPPHQRHPEAREADALVVAARAEGEQVEWLQGVHRVGAAVAQVDDAVAGADLCRGAALPGEPAAAEHVEDLLLQAVLVSRRGPSARWKLDPAQAHSDRPRSLAEQCPAPAQVAQRELAGRSIVEVGDPHQRLICARGCASK